MVWARCPIGVRTAPDLRLSSALPTVSARCSGHHCSPRVASELVVVTQLHQQSQAGSIPFAGLPTHSSTSAPHVPPVRQTRVEASRVDAAWQPVPCPCLCYSGVGCAQRIACVCITALLLVCIACLLRSACRGSRSSLATRLVVCCCLLSLPLASASSITGVAHP